MNTDKKEFITVENKEICFDPTECNIRQSNKTEPQKKQGIIPPVDALILIDELNN